MCIIYTVLVLVLLLCVVLVSCAIGCVGRPS